MHLRYYFVNKLSSEQQLFKQTIQYFLDLKNLKTFLLIIRVEALLLCHNPSLPFCHDYECLIFREAVLSWTCTSPYMSYHDDDFEEDSIEEDIPDEAPLDVQVTNPGESSSQQSLAGFPDIEIDYSYENEKFDGGSDCDDNDNLELHGRGERMKLSMKPPEVLLRLYQKQIENAKEKKKVYD